MSRTEASAAQTLMRSSGISNRSCSSACRVKREQRVVALAPRLPSTMESRRTRELRTHAPRQSRRIGRRVDDPISASQRFFIVELRVWCRSENRQTTKSYLCLCVRRRDGYSSRVPAANVYRQAAKDASGQDWIEFSYYAGTNRVFKRRTTSEATDITPYLRAATAAAGRLQSSARRRSISRPALG